jgi:hypothetical protein
MLTNLRKENLIMLVVQINKPIAKRKLNCLFIVNINPPYGGFFISDKFNCPILYQIINQYHSKNSQKQEIA